MHVPKKTRTSPESDDDSTSSRDGWDVGVWRWGWLVDDGIVMFQMFLLVVFGIFSALNILKCLSFLKPCFLDLFSLFMVFAIRLFGSV